MYYLHLNECHAISSNKCTAFTSLFVIFCATTENEMKTVVLIRFFFALMFTQVPIWKTGCLLRQDSQPSESY